MAKDQSISQQLLSLVFFVWQNGREHLWYHSGIGPIPTFASMSGFLMDGEQECWHSNVPVTFSPHSQRGSEALIIPTKTVWLTTFWTRQKPKEQECAFYHADFSLRLKNCPKNPPPTVQQKLLQEGLGFIFFFFLNDEPEVHFFPVNQQQSDHLWLSAGGKTNWLLKTNWT